MRGLDIAVLCSHSEGFPNTVGEAMATGLPCAATDVGDAARIVGDTGLICPPRNPQALADPIEQLTKEGPKALSERGALARRRIIEQFSLDEIADRYRDLWDSVIRG